MNKRGHSAFSSAQKKQDAPNKERGFILIAVIIAITLVAAIAFVLSQQGAIETNVTSGELERDHLRYVAEAGIAHAKLQLSPSDTCDAYANIRSTGFGAATYAANVSPAQGSPVSVTATGALMSGAQYTLRRDHVKVYSASTIQTISIQPGTEGDDAEIWDVEPDNNYGSAGETWVSSASDDKTRSLLRFNLGAIPAGAKIMEASLFLTHQSGSGANQPVSAHRIMKSWSEDSVTWNSRVSGTNWDTAGGDFNDDAVATTLVGPVNQRYEWDITPLVQGWVDGSYPNYGVVLAAAIAGMPGERFYTSDQSNLDRRPGLSVSYACECGKTCAVGESKNLLLVVGDAASPSGGDLDRKALIESWGYAVTLIDDGDSKANFNTAVAASDVVYNAGSGSSAEVGTKLTAATIGVLSEDIGLVDELGLAEPLFVKKNSQHINVIDNTHYVTSGFDLGTLQLYSYLPEIWTLTGTLAPGLQLLGETQDAVSTFPPGLAVLEAGAELYGGGFAAGRRVQVPWAQGSFDINGLNADGQTIMRRAIEWGARGPRENPVAHWKFDDGSGLTALDSEGGHDGTLLNGPAWVPGKLDTALDFDGSDDVVEVPQTNDLDLSTFTVAAWIRLSALTTSQTILEKRDGADLATVNYLLLAAGNEITWAFYDGGWASFSTDTANMEVDTWYHVAGTYDNLTGEGNVYVNGVLLATGTTTQNPPLVPGTVRIGDSECAACSDKWNGSLDDVRIYNRALSASDVADLAVGGGGNAYRDEFNTQSFAGSDASLVWATNWLEIGESDGPDSGNARVLNDVSDFQLELKNKDIGIEREADLSGCASATLSFQYRRHSLDDADDYLAVEGSSNGGGTWTEIDRLLGPATDSIYQSASHDISAYIAINARIRLLTSPSNGKGDKFYFDDIQIACTP